MVTPFGIAVRGIFNSSRMYSATNLTLLGFLLAFKVRVKIENGQLYYSLNNGESRPVFPSKDNDKERKININTVKKVVVLEKVDIKIRFGIGGDAMNTALLSSLIMNGLSLMSEFIDINKKNIEVSPDFESDYLALDLEIKARYAFAQIIIAALRILFQRKKDGKYRKHNAGHTA